MKIMCEQRCLFDRPSTFLECRVEKLTPQYGVAQLSNCPVIAGNSGSPVLDKDQNVVGIIFASSNNHIRKPSDELGVRTKSDSKGFAFSIDYVQGIIGNLL